MNTVKHFLGDKIALAGDFPQKGDTDNTFDDNSIALAR